MSELAELAADAEVHELAEEVELEPMHPRLRDIPSGVLFGGSRGLDEWCTSHGYRPTLLEVVTERQRRRQRSQEARAARQQRASGGVA